MLTVAVVGADGSGKSTVVAQVQRELPHPARRMYLGVSAESATHPLPSTRAVRWARAAAGRPPRPAGPPPLAGPAGAPTGPRRSPLRRAAKATARAGGTANRIAEEAYQEAISRWHRAHGRIVIYDRFYPADFHAHDLAGRPGLPPSRRIHAAFLRRCFAPPDLLVVLDAEPELLHARKGEGTLAELAARREEYLAYAATVPVVEVVRADRPLADVVDQVIAAIDRATRSVPGAARPDHPPVPGSRPTEEVAS